MNLLQSLGDHLTMARVLREISNKIHDYITRGYASTRTNLKDFNISSNTSGVVTVAMDISARQPSSSSLRRYKMRICPVTFVKQERSSH